MDLSKAFDSIPHALLLAKLKAYGLCETSIVLLRSYLSTRIQRVKIGHVRYINILTWLRGFQVKLLYLVMFLLYPSLFWELRDKGNLKNLQF